MWRGGRNWKKKAKIREDVSGGVGGELKNWEKGKD